MSNTVAAMADASLKWTVQPRSTGADYSLKADGYGSLVTTFQDTSADVTEPVTQLLLRGSVAALGNNGVAGDLVSNAVGEPSRVCGWAVQPGFHGSPHPALYCLYCLTLQHVHVEEDRAHGAYACLRVGG